MDVRFLPFVKSSRSVRRPDDEASVDASGARSAAESLPYCRHSPTSSTLTRRGGGGGITLSRHLLPTSSLEREGGARIPGWDVWEEDSSSFRDLPNPSQLRKRARGGESTSGGSSGVNQRRRTQEDRPDVFDHLAQLRRKQHRFEEQSALQAVPSSPQQQWSSDPSLSFHGLTPTKVYCDRDTRTTLPAPPIGATHHQGEGSDVSGSMPQTGFSAVRESPGNGFSTEASIWEQLDQSGREMFPSGGGAGGLRPHPPQLRDCRPHPPKSLFAFHESVLPETEASFSSVPSLAVEDPEEDDDGLAEVVSSSTIIETSTPYINSQYLSLTLSPSRRRVRPPLLPEPWSPSVTSPVDEPPEPCTFDPSTFSIKLYYPREE